MGGNGWGEEVVEISELACADSCGRRGAREWLEMGGK